VLREYTKQRPGRRCLYLTFNKDVQLEKQREFRAAGLNHVDVKTVNAIAHSPTRHLHPDGVADGLYLNCGHLQALTGKSFRNEMVAAIKEVFSRFCATTDARIGQEHLPCTEAYQAAKRNCNVPWEWAENPQLGNWVSTQRMQKRKLDEGKASSMTAARVARLEALGFRWAR
jgi:hypothetical protein